MKLFHTWYALIAVAVGLVGCNAETAKVPITSQSPSSASSPTGVVTEPADGKNMSNSARADLTDSAVSTPDARAALQATVATAKQKDKRVLVHVGGPG